MIEPVDAFSNTKPTIGPLMRRHSVLLIALLFPRLALAQYPTPQGVAVPAPVARQNPFSAASSLPFQAPPFDKIGDADFQPAIEEGMTRNLAEVEAIANNPDAPTFANTIEAMERSGAMLTRVQRVFGALTQSNTNPTLQRIQADEAPKLAAHRDTIYLNPKLFARVKTIYDQRDALNLDAESKWLVERYFRNFIRAGAQLSDADKTTLKALNQEESTLSTQYRQHVLADTKDSAIVVGKKADLAGLSESDIAAAAQGIEKLIAIYFSGTDDQLRVGVVFAIAGEYPHALCAKLFGEFSVL